MVPCRLVHKHERFEDFVVSVFMVVQKHDTLVNIRGRVLDYREGGRAGSAETLVIIYEFIKSCIQRTLSTHSILCENS